MIDAIKDIDSVAKIVRDVLNNNLSPDIKFRKICTPVGVEMAYNNEDGIPFRIVVAYDLTFPVTHTKFGAWILRIDLFVDNGSHCGGDQLLVNITNEDSPEFDKDDIKNAAVKLANYINKNHKEYERARKVDLLLAK